ncbi:phasin family protein [Thermomonas alba]|uniref:phasin family protein n=1 Tax=Thermomonas alba TaxID=2888525 RepID=UPI001F0346FA|nr:phasin family protein [Thermomonas alba]
MYSFNLNEQFSKTAAQFADAAAEIHRLALSNAEKALGLHMAALEENLSATFAFAGELVDVRDPEALKTVWPKGLQVARTNAERSLGAVQEAFAHTLKTYEAVGTLAKRQFEQVGEQVKAEAEKTAKAGAKAAK